MKQSYNDQKPNFSLSGIFITALYLVVGYFIVYFVFPNYESIYKVCAYLIIGIQVLAYLGNIIPGNDKINSKSEINHRNNKNGQERIYVETPNDTNISSELSMSETLADILYNKSEKIISLDYGEVITIENICIEIKQIINSFKVNFPNIQNPLKKVKEFPKVNHDELLTIPVFDLCKIFNFLGLKIENNTPELTILLIGCGNLLDSDFDYKNLVNDRELVNCEKAILNDFICSANPISHDLLLGPIVFNSADNPDFKSNYLTQLLDFSAKIVTLDNKIEKTEKKLLELLNDLKHQQ